MAVNCQIHYDGGQFRERRAIETDDEDEQAPKPGLKAAARQLQDPDGGLHYNRLIDASLDLTDH
jgi:hypothetical protein